MPSRKKFKLSDGSEMNVYEVMIKYEEKWNETISESLAFVRLTHSDNPRYIFSKKGLIVGHEYCKIAKAKKIAAEPKQKKIPDERLQSMKWYADGTKRQFYDPMWKLIMKNI
tara:strand:- start:322 stop:657 length:336 start_codon:yes stop_codon:yes gene_type:complete